MAKSLPVSSRAQMSSAPAPGPHPISSTWSSGWTSMTSTAQRSRAGIVCTGMGDSLPLPLRHCDGECHERRRVAARVGALAWPLSPLGAAVTAWWSD